VGKYPKEFRRKAVERLKSCDNIVELSQELGVHRRLLYKWRDQFDPFDPGEKSYSGKAKDAEEEMRSAVAANPDQFKALAYLGAMLYYEGKVDEAESELDRAVLLGRDSEDITPPLLAAFLYASRGQREKIDARLLQYRPTQIIDGDGAYWLGGIHALLGDSQNALDWLKRTVALGNVNYPWFERDKNYDSLRSDPEYQTIMAGVRQRWEAYKKEFDVAP
jgi:eukaryotic-like serine/threonine-protein kinase